MQFIVSGQRIAVENFVTGKLYTILWKNDTQVTLTCISIGADCVVFQGEAPLNLFTLTMQNADTIDTIEPTQLGTTNYNNLINKPSINGVDLIGNKTSSDLGIREVPAVIETDEGKVLTADDDGTYSWQELPEGTTNYNDLSNKPQINSVTLTGNVSLEDLGAAAAADIPTTPADIGAEPAITSENMLDADLVDDSNSTNKFATAAQLAQIAINETNISLCQAFTNNASIDSDRKLYISATAPTGNIPIGSTWIDGKTIYTYNRSNNEFNKEDYVLSNLYVSTTDNIVYPSDSVESIILSCEPSTTYYVGKTKGNRFSLRTFENVPVQGTLFNGVSVSATGQTEAFITTGANDHYILLFVSYTPDTDTMAEIAATIMYTASSTAVPYKSYYDWV